MRQSQKAANLRASRGLSEQKISCIKTRHVSRFTFHHFHHFLLILQVPTAFKAESRPLLQSEWPVLDLAQGWFHKVHPDLRSALVYHQFAPWVLRCHFWPFPNHQITCHNTPVQRCRPTWAISSHRISVFLAWKKGILEFRIMEAPLSSPTTWAEHMLLSCRYRSWRKLYAHWFAGLDVLTSSLGHWSLIPALGVYVFYVWYYRWTRHCSPMDICFPTFSFELGTKVPTRPLQWDHGIDKR